MSATAFQRARRQAAEKAAADALLGSTELTEEQKAAITAAEERQRLAIEAEEKAKAEADEKAQLEQEEADRKSAIIAIAESSNLGEMTVVQLKQFAANNSIDISGAKNASDAVRLIKEYLGMV